MKYLAAEDSTGVCIVLCMQVIDKVQDEVYVQRPPEGHPFCISPPSGALLS